MTTTENPTANQHDTAEFTDFKGIEKRFGIGQTLAYQLLAQNHIKSVSIRQPGRIRGKRLFNIASIREYLASLEGK